MTNRIPVQIIFSLRQWTPRSVKTWAEEHGYEFEHMKCDEYDVIANLCERSRYVTTTMERKKFGILEGVELVTARARTPRGFKMKMLKAEGTPS